jgi:phage-related protein
MFRRTSPPKPLFWVGSSRNDLKSFPPDAQDVIGRALLDAQFGGKHPHAKPLQGFGGAGVVEVVLDLRGEAYRAVYTVRFQHAVYVLHAFQKKSSRGIATPKYEIDRVRQRLRLAEAHHTARERGARG